jgi:hypothetical protein
MVHFKGEDSQHTSQNSSITRDTNPSIVSAYVTHGCRSMDAADRRIEAAVRSTLGLQWTSGIPYIQFETEGTPAGRESRRQHIELLCNQLASEHPEWIIGHMVQDVSIALYAAAPDQLFRPQGMRAGHQPEPWDNTRNALHSMAEHVEHLLEEPALCYHADPVDSWEQGDHQLRIHSRNLVIIEMRGYRHPRDSASESESV